MSDWGNAMSRGADYQGSTFSGRIQAPTKKQQEATGWGSRSSGNWTQALGGKSLLGGGSSGTGITAPKTTSTGVSSPSSSPPLVGAIPPNRPGYQPPKPPGDYQNAGRPQDSGSASSSSSTAQVNLPFLDFDKMFEYQKRINNELDIPNMQLANKEGYGYRKMEADDQSVRDYGSRNQAAALQMQRDVLSSDLERGTMRTQQQLATKTKDQDLARAMSIVIGGRK